VDKLALRFKGRPDIAILALIVDDDPNAMRTAWLMTPSRTSMFTREGSR